MPPISRRKVLEDPSLIAQRHPEIVATCPECKGPIRRPLGHTGSNMVLCRNCAAFGAWTPDGTVRVLTTQEWMDFISKPEFLPLIESREHLVEQLTGAKEPGA